MAQAASYMWGITFIKIHQSIYFIIIILSFWMLWQLYRFFKGLESTKIA